ncbi:MAG TPA: molybdopterin cofactor-binding domain-containing protein [Rhodanobacteraceae bacterium]|nr:molybdopterin cofactor-binding domain-containing protein [Rhodanobacteraceae bacterium]
MSHADWTRRHFLKVLASASGALVIGASDALAQDFDTPLPLLGNTVTELGPYLRIEPDGDIFIGARAPEFGQGSHTVLARLIADELDADWSRVRVLPLPLAVREVDGETRFPLAPQDARGSTTVANAWKDLRQAGASARWLLMEAARRQWRLPMRDLHCANSEVIARDGRRATYGALVQAAARLPLPTPAPTPKSADVYQLIGQPASDVDARALVQGQHRFPIDRWLGETLVAVIARCPYLDGEIERVDDAATLKVHGVVKTLRLDSPDASQPLGTQTLSAGVAVLATDTWAALQGRKALKVEWRQRRFADQSSTGLETQALALLDQPASGHTLRSDGDVDGALERIGKRARRQLDRHYSAPFLAHVTMEPLSCLVAITDSHIRVEAPTQDPAAAYAVIQRLTGLKPAQIELEFPRMGGGFGRRLESDHVAEAVLLAQGAGRPVKLMWTRDDDLRHDVYRPFAVQRLQAALDRHGKPLAWRHQLASTPRNAGRGLPAGRLWQGECFPDALPAGLVPDYQMVWHALDTGAPCGNWRAPAHNLTAFATECFLDELAHLNKLDPLALRLQLLGDARALPYRGFGGPVIDTGRMAAVLQAVAARIDWPKPRRNGHGLGIACHYSFGSYAAHALEVSFEQGRLRFHRAVCAVDVGRAVNPRGVQAQVESATLDGIAAALDGAITLDQGRVVQQNLADYRIARSAELPYTVEAIVLPSNATPTGAGEVALPSAAPALANAIFAASTVRIHRLPLRPEIRRLL